MSAVSKTPGADVPLVDEVTDERRVVALLDGGIEGVHVRMRDDPHETFPFSG